MPGDDGVGTDAWEARVAELLEAMREQASRTLMFHQAITELVGLGPTDMKALDLARDEAHLTAGKLAKATGLSTSATTAVLDRLERRGFVQRQRDPADRRTVVVVATGRHAEQLHEIFADLAERVREILADYDTDQLALMLELVRRLNRAADELTRSVTARGQRDRR